MRGWGRSFAVGVWLSTAAAQAASAGAAADAHRIAFVEEEVRELASVEGQVAAVDLAQGTVTLQLEGAVLVVRVDAGTTIFLAGRTGRLADLSAGQRVRAAYEQDPEGRTPVAQWIELAR
jgi:hypothetical protein